MPLPVPPKIFPGRVHRDNRSAIDWGRHNLVAYANHSYVVVVDPLSLSIIQTLDEHKANIVSVKWSNETIHNDYEKPYKLRLASGDKIGCIIIWNVLEAGVAITLQDPTLKQVMDMKWHPKDPNLLVSLHLPSALILWNTLTGTKVWKLDFNEQPSWFEFNPFDITHVSLATSTGSIYFVLDFKNDTKPSQVELKYTITNNNKGAKSPAPSSDFQQMLFSPHTRNIIYFLLSREVIIFDITIHQAVGSIVLERSRASFFQLLLLREEPNLFFCMHEDGSMSAWNKRKSEYKYDLECFSDIVRFNKQNKKKGVAVHAIANNPLAERSISTISNDGNLWIWDYSANHAIGGPKFCITGLVENISSPISSFSVSPFSSESDSLIAVGTYHGSVQIMDMVRSVVKAEFTLWSQAVRGVRWFSPTSIIAFNCEEVGKNEYKNKVCILDIKTGKQTEIRKMSGAENTFIRAIRISSARQYFIVLLKDRPFELWDMKTLTLLRTMKPFLQITSLEWSPLKVSSPFESNKEIDHKSVKEQFVFSLPDGSLRFYSVVNGVISASDIHADLGMGVVSSLAWKGDYLVSGDTLGGIHCWNFATKKAQVFATSKGMIRRIRFSPSLQNHQIIVHFNEGDFGIWDLDHNIRLSVSSYLKGRDLKAIDCDWISETTPVVATTDGCIRILDRSLSISNSTFMFNTVAISLNTPYLLPTTQALHLKVLLQHYISPGKFEYDNKLPSKEEEVPTPMKRTSVEQALLECMDAKVLSSIQSSGGIAERALAVAKYFGQEDEASFWTIVLWAFKKFTNETCNSSTRPSEVKSESNESRTFDGIFPSTDSNAPRPLVTSQLPAYMDLLLESEAVRSIELERATIQESKKSGYDLTKKIAEFNILLGQKEKAIQLLLETPIDNPHFYADSLKAAVIAASLSPDSFRNTIKLVATNLIANGNIDEGVQLLCLIGKAFDACRYLQSYDRWTDAAWLAKIALSETECADIMKRWANWMNVTGQRMKAVQLLATLGEFHALLQLLHESRQFDIAALFAAACAEKGFIFHEPANIASSATIGKQKMEITQGPFVPVEQLLQSIHLDYGFFLHRLGNVNAAEFYWKRAGPPGENMIETVRASALTPRDKKKT